MTVSDGFPSIACIGKCGRLGLPGYEAFTDNVAGIRNFGYVFHDIKKILHRRSNSDILFRVAFQDDKFSDFSQKCPVVSRPLRGHLLAPSLAIPT
jgi:hypothetical protein